MADPRIWGTDLWKTMHRLSLSYPRVAPTRAQRQAARSFFKSLGQLLPCISCRTHYAQHFARTFAWSTTASRAALVRWVHGLHEAVNKRLGKPTGVVRVDDLARLYNAFPLRYVCADGQKLLNEPRFSTVGNDFGCGDDAKSNSSTDSKRAEFPPLSDTLRRAIAVHDALAETMANVDDDLANATSQTPVVAPWLWIVLAGAVLVCVAAVAVCFSLHVKRQREQSLVRDAAVKKQ